MKYNRRDSDGAVINAEVTNQLFRSPMKIKARRSLPLKRHDGQNDYFRTNKDSNPFLKFRRANISFGSRIDEAIKTARCFTTLNVLLNAFFAAQGQTNGARDQVTSGDQ